MSGWDNLFNGAPQENGEQQQAPQPNPNEGSPFSFGNNAPQDFNQQPNRPQRAEDLPPRPSPQRPDLNSSSEAWFVTPEAPQRNMRDTKVKAKVIVSILTPLISVIVVIGIIGGLILLALSSYNPDLFQPKNPDPIVSSHPSPASTESN